MNRNKIFYIASEYWRYVANGKKSRNPNIGLMSVSIGLIPDPAPNPFSANGGVSGCGQGATITVWLTDANGNQTFGTGTLTQQQDGSWTWSATFPQMPGGDYTFTVQIQYDGQTANASTDVNLSSPSQKGLKARQPRPKVASK